MPQPSVKTEVGPRPERTIPGPLITDRRPEHVALICKLGDITAHLEAMGDYDLLAMSTHPIGTGYGAWIQAVLVFRLRRVDNAA